MIWPMPPKIKIYEALGAIGDRRIELDGDNAKLYSSSGNKFYIIRYNSENNEIYSNDNASFFVGYLGYPAIAFLFARGLLQYDVKIAEALTGIKWKDINQRHKNNFEKTMLEVNSILESKGFNPEKVADDTSKIMEHLESLDLQKPLTLIKPPKGY